jgi:outer membrane protein
MPCLDYRFGLALVLLLTTMACAADDLVSAYRAALLHDPQWSAANAEHLAGQESEVQARAGLWPELSLQAQQAWTRTQYQLEHETMSDSRRNQTLSIQLVQPLFRWKHWVQYQQGTQQAALATCRFHEARQALLLRVAEAYFEVLGTEAQVHALRQQQTAGVQLLASARKHFELGNASITDVHDAQASAEQTEAALIAAISQVEKARHALASMTGRSPGVLRDLREGVQFPAPAPADIAFWLASARQDAYAVQVQALRLAIAQNEVRNRNAEHLPTLDLVASRGIQHQPSIGNERSDLSSISLRFQLPLYGGGRATSAVRQAQALRAQSEALHEDAMRIAQLQVHEAWLEIRDGQAQARSLGTAKSSATTALEANRLGYQVGVRVSRDVLDAQGRLTEVTQRLARVRYAILLAQLRLKAAVGGLMEKDLHAVNELLAYSEQHLNAEAMRP